MYHKIIDSLKGSLDLERDPDIQKMLELGSDPEIQQLESSLAMARSKEQTRKIIRKLLIKSGTDVDLNDKDTYGDGDQTLIDGFELESQRQILRNLFAAGGDIEHHMIGGKNTAGLTDFAWSCIKGDTKAVERKLKATSLKGQRYLIELMEYRQTSMRLPPLLLTVALSKHKKTVNCHSQFKIANMDHVGVFRVLIRYGARPDAKDVTGKTVCHYGAGCMATEETLEMTRIAVEATKTCAFFGHEVVLNGLIKNEYNGMKGTLGGYVAEKDRLVVRPVAGSVVSHEMSLKPENIFIIEKKNGSEERQQSHVLECAAGSRINLIDMKDRLGSISLHEVAMSERDDVAKFLCKNSTSCLDVADGSGTTVRQMMCANSIMSNKAITVLKRYAAKEGANKEQCAKCGEKEGKLQECSRCLSVVYCSKEYQVSHWKSKHKHECKLLQKKGELILGQPFTLESGQFFFDLKGKKRKDNYGPPNNLKKAGESFWIKVQSNGINHHILIYDKSRTCEFSLPPGENGHSELVEKVTQNQTFLGRKSFFKAKFNEEGKCVVYLTTSTSLKW